MEINDETIIELFFGKRQFKNAFYKKVIKDTNNEIYKYLINRYNDSDSIRETIYRIKLHINKKPICPTCGNYIKFTGCGFNDHCSQYCSRHDINVLNKDEQTRELRYGDKHFVNKEKRFKTNLDKYGDFCPVRNEDVKNKMYDTKLKKYGNGYFCNQKKSENTCLMKYGEKTPLHLKEIHEKSKQTFLEKYGVEKPLQSELFKESFKKTCLEHFGVEHHMLNEEFKNKKFNFDEIHRKSNITKRKNHTFKTSKKETESYYLIKEKYDDVDYQYKSDVYPFFCDFYIPSLDLYIECNYHWTHGGHPYKGDEQDLKLVNIWKLKQSNYYNNAINCWTIRDVNKRNIAKQNNLNWIEFWNINELKKWLDK